MATEIRETESWIEFKGKWATWCFESVDRDGDVAVECLEERTGSNTLFLSQDALKQLITFLQKQVK